MSLSPWTTNFGGLVSYWHPPLNSSLEESERIVVRLPKTDVLGVNPGKGTSDALDAAKHNELRSNLYWGRMVLAGWGAPNVTLRSLYNVTEKIIDIREPIVFPKETQAGNPNILLYGLPMLVFDVQKVSRYEVDIETLSDPCNVTVKAMNATGAIVTDWNGTVDLTGEVISNHTFVPSDNGVWNTTMPFPMSGSCHLYAIDRWFCPQNVEDVVRGYAYIVIPEEPYESAPNAILEISVGYYYVGNESQALFNYDASNSSDNETPVGRLLVRWDFEGDGIWDTAWSANKTISHHYAVNGTYTVILQVMDERGLTDTASQMVSSTGEIIPEFGTVLIPVLGTLAAVVLASRLRKNRS